MDIQSRYCVLLNNEPNQNAVLIWISNQDIMFCSVMNLIEVWSAPQVLNREDIKIPPALPKPKKSNNIF